ncbi:MAG: 6-bladed beta-propeller [Bacteroidota bacterium]
MKNRRNFIKTSANAALGTIAFPTLSAAVGRHKRSSTQEVILGHGDYQYKLHTNWAQVGALRNPLLNCHEMVMDSKGRLIMIGDHTANNILIFDKSGKLLDYWGTAYPGGHGLTLNEEGGEDFLYLTDSGWYVNRRGELTRHNGRVTKTTLDGKVIFDIGHPQTIGVYEEGDHFCPTEVAVAPNGDIYVADGYGKDFILQYDSKGQFIRKWGGHDNADKNYNLHNAHGVTIDLRDKNNPQLICSSRNENAYKFFTLEGKYVRTLHLTNMYACRAVLDDNNLYAGVCWSIPEGETKFDWLAHTGFITVLEGDKVVSNPGGTPPEYKNGELQPAYQLSQKPIWHGHDVCVDEDKNLYVCQWNAGRTAPYKLERI